MSSFYTNPLVMQIDEGVPKTYTSQQLLAIFDDQSDGLKTTYGEYTQIHGHQLCKCS